MADTTTAQAASTGTVWPGALVPTDHFFVLKHSDGVPGQVYGESYVADQKNPNAIRLQEAVESGQPVYCFIYKFAPDSALTAWAQIIDVIHPRGSTQLIFHLSQHEFPVKVHYRGKMNPSLPWVANLDKPNLLIQTISQSGFQHIINWAKDLENLLELAKANADSILASSKTKKAQFNNTVYLLLEHAPGREKNLHLQYEILEIMQKVDALKIEAENPQTWLHRVVAEDLRFTNKGGNSNVWRLSTPEEIAARTIIRLESEESPSELTIWKSAQQVLEEAETSLHLIDILDRMKEKQLKIPAGNEAQQRATLSAVMHRRPHIFKFLRQNMWVLEDSNGASGKDNTTQDPTEGYTPTNGTTDPTPVGIETPDPIGADKPGGTDLVTQLEPPLEDEVITPPEPELTELVEVELEDAALRVLRPEEFDDKLKELAADFLFDEQVVRRIYRSLIAGHHVVLSGPPGTGKTELARRLPELLWREEAPDQLENTTGAEATDDERQAAEAKQTAYKGYFAHVVTATEDWGVRDVIGGIGPRLSSADDNRLAYAIQYGELSKAILLNYKNTAKGQQLPENTANPVRVAYQPPNPKIEGSNERKEQYRGVWLVIDEFTRAPVDAAFGTLLTTLGSSGGRAHLVVPAESNHHVALPLPQDFRIIGTLNSFDRHFLNQISEALKRRFDFIDVLPPTQALAAAEQGIALKRALGYLIQKSFSDKIALSEPIDGQFSYSWDGQIQLTLVTEEVQGIARLVYKPEEAQQNPEIRAVLVSFWKIFEAIRTFRQLGTAQAVAVYTNLFAGALTGMSWPVALDSALADTLADQLQVLNRDEQELLLAYLAHAGNPATFKSKFGKLWQRLSEGRRRSLAYTLSPSDSSLPDDESESAEPDLDQLLERLSAVFRLGEPLALPQFGEGQFYRRLRNIIYERGL